MSERDDVVEAAAREGYVEDAAVRMRNSVSSVHAQDAYELERRQAAERWDDAITYADSGLGLVPRTHWRLVMRAAVDAADRARWKPIETAPKGGPIWVGKWANRFDDGRRYWHCSKLDGSDLEGLDLWTHWQPDQEPLPPERVARS